MNRLNIAVNMAIAGILYAFLIRLSDFINKFLSVVVGGNPLPSGGGRSLIDCRYRTYVL